MFDTIAVVCTGNICRSPIAEALLKAALPNKTVLSAGTMAMVGDGAWPLSQQVSLDHGLDLSAHRTQQLTATLLRQADLVLTLDASHSAWIHRRHPESRGKVHLLGRWRGDEDVPDPYGLTKPAFEAGYQQMAALVQDWLPHLK